MEQKQNSKTSQKKPYDIMHELYESNKKDDLPSAFKRYYDHQIEHRKNRKKIDIEEDMAGALGIERDALRKNLREFHMRKSNRKKFIEEYNNYSKDNHLRPLVYREFEFLNELNKNNDSEITNPDTIDAFLAYLYQLLNDFTLNECVLMLLFCDKIIGNEEEDFFQFILLSTELSLEYTEWLKIYLDYLTTEKNSEIAKNIIDPILSSDEHALQLIIEETFGKEFFHPEDSYLDFKDLIIQKLIQKVELHPNAENSKIYDILVILSTNPSSFYQLIQFLKLSDSLIEPNINTAQEIALLLTHHFYVYLAPNLIDLEIKNSK